MVMNPLSVAKPVVGGAEREMWTTFSDVDIAYFTRGVGGRDQGVISGVARIRVD